METIGNMWPFHSNLQRNFFPPTILKFSSALVKSESIFQTHLEQEDKKIFKGPWNYPGYARILLICRVSSEQGFSNFCSQDPFPFLIIIEKFKDLCILLIFLLLEIKIEKWKNLFKVSYKNSLYVNVNNILVKITFFKAKIVRRAFYVSVNLFNA